MRGAQRLEALTLAMLVLAVPLLAATAPAEAQSPAELSPRVHFPDEARGAIDRPSAASAATAGDTAAVIGHPTAAPGAARDRSPARRDRAAADRGTVPAASGVDRLQLGVTQISGNRELPKVMVIVPWRHGAIGPFAGRPPNSLVDEALSAVDRDEFDRENRYYRALAGAAASTGASTADPASVPAVTSGAAGTHAGGSEKQVSARHRPFTSP